MPPTENGVCSFKAEQVADRELCQLIFSGSAPQSRVLFHIRLGAQLHQFAALFHDSVPGELALRVCPCLLRTAPAGELAESSRIARDLRGDAQSDASPSHLG